MMKKRDTQHGENDGHTEHATAFRLLPLDFGDASLRMFLEMGASKLLLALVFFVWLKSETAQDLGFTLT